MTHRHFLWPVVQRLCTLHTVSLSLSAEPEQFAVNWYYVCFGRACVGINEFKVQRQRLGHFVTDVLLAVREAPSSDVELPVVDTVYLIVTWVRRQLHVMFAQSTALTSVVGLRQACICQRGLTPVRNGWLLTTSKSSCCGGSKCFVTTVA